MLDIEEGALRALERWSPDILALVAWHTEFLDEQPNDCFQ
jgi:hypothetical protein